MYGQFKTWSAAAQQSVGNVMIDLLNDWKQDQQKLRERFDTNQDGSIDQKEWEIARQQAQSEAQKIHDQLALEPDTNIIAKPENSDTAFYHFNISASQTDSAISPQYLYGIDRVHDIYLYYRLVSSYPRIVQLRELNYCHLV